VVVAMASIKQLVTEVKSEFDKVHWPTRQEAINATMLVAIISVFVSIYVGAFDLIFSKFIERLVAIFGG
jgi:preprotein translocase subunit SecE